MSIETDYRMVPNLIKSALRKQPVNIYGTGNQTRTFCYYTDAIEGIIKVIRLSLIHISEPTRPY